jgi:tRNA G18 (ribose-2'-O)-methylase SpoU
MVPAFSLILPDIRSCHNVGAMFRSADACGFDRIFLTGYTPTPPRPEIHKVALGADEWIPWEHRPSLVSLIHELRQQGVEIVALEKTSTSIDIATALFHAPIALIVGNEVDGVSREVLDHCDRVVHIPMHGKKESLNVSIAAGIAMYVIGNAS